MWWEETKLPCRLSKYASQGILFYSSFGGETSAGTLNYQMQVILGTKYDSFDLDSQKT